MSKGPWGVLLVAAAFMLMAAAPHEAEDRPTVVWGDYGHQLAAEVAVARLPDEMPDFFRAAGLQLAYLNPEPDRWRDNDRPEMNEAYRYDHYIDLENVPERAFGVRDRYRFIEALYDAGIESPQVSVGFLPFHILELQQRVTNDFERWRAERDPARRAWIEARIVNDAGILGHFVTDASNPHHSTVHFDGWDENAAPNPGGVTTRRGFHARFESDFVSRFVTRRQLTTRVVGPARKVDDVRAAVWGLVRDSNAEVVRLYELDRDVGLRTEGPADPEALAFAADRLALGARYLRDLWWTAWLDSAAP